MLSLIEMPGSSPHVFLAEFKFVGFPFYLSLLLLWLFLQGLVWLAERYSSMVSGIQWWRSGLVGVICTMVMVLAWSIPRFVFGGETDNVIHAMTSGLIFGSVAAWFLCGQLYHFDVVNRIIVAIGVPILVLCSIALGQVWAR